MINKKWLMYGAAALAVILILGAAIAYLGGDPETAALAGSAATAAAAAAEKSRRAARAEIIDAKADNAETVGQVEAFYEKAKADMKAEADKVGRESDADKVADGNDLFG